VADRVDARRQGSGNGNEQQKTPASSSTAGRYLVYAAGLAFLAGARSTAIRAVTCKFKKKLKTAR
jgi:hypothetical protein